MNDEQIYSIGSNLDEDLFFVHESRQPGVRTLKEALQGHYHVHRRRPKGRHTKCKNKHCTVSKKTAKASGCKVSNSYTNYSTEWVNTWIDHHNNLSQWKQTLDEVIKL